MNKSKGNPNFQGKKKGGNLPQENAKGPKFKQGKAKNFTVGPPDWVLEERLMAIGGPLQNLPPKEEGMRKFSNHNRLWLGNIPSDVNEDEMRSLLSQFGEYDELYIDASKGFALVRYDYKSSSEKAKQELSQKVMKGKNLKVRNSNPGTSLKIRNLPFCVTNEYLELAFGVFGELERAIVITDDRGRPTGEGIVEYCKKPNAQVALNKANEGCFILTATPRPVIVEPMPVVDEDDGYGEMIAKRSAYFNKEREWGPRFAVPGSFEYDYAMQWKELYENFDKKRELLESELADEKKRLEEKIEFAKYQHETERLRRELEHREQYGYMSVDDFQQRRGNWDDYMYEREGPRSLMDDPYYPDMNQSFGQGGGFPGNPKGSGIKDRLGARTQNFGQGSGGGQGLAQNGRRLDPPKAVLENPMVKTAIFRVYKELVKDLYPNMGPDRQLERAKHLSTMPLSELTAEEREFVLSNEDVMAAIDQSMYEFQNSSFEGAKKRKKGNM